MPKARKNDRVISDKSARPVWKIYKYDKRRVELFSKELGISEVCGQILLNRGIRTLDEAKLFLYGTLDSLPEPALMKGMSVASRRIKRAVSSHEKILIYGDYDVDGVTSCALLGKVLKGLGADWDVFIPNRLEDGYGVNVDAVRKAFEDGVKLIVTVDCGINSIEEVSLANSLGMDVIVTDHHEVKGRQIPEAFAVIDPHQPGCPYPYKNLAGVGIAYKLAQSLLGREVDISSYLDLVALGSVADVVSLRGENRVLVKNGLKNMSKTKNLGIKALLDMARVEGPDISARKISFGIAPRINAMGRMGSARMAFELLMSDSEEEAKTFAKKLEKSNLDRRKVESKVLEEALEKAETELDLNKDKVAVLASENWHSGVIGIVASRISERYHMPAILIALKGETGKGSGRGVYGMDLFKAVQQAEEHLIQFGGHEQACGLSIKKEEVEPFRKKLNEVISGIMPRDIPAKEIRIDFQLPFAHISRKLIEEVKLLMPYGEGNDRPIFATGGLRVMQTPRNIGKNGFKFHVRCGNISCEAISFRRDLLPRPQKGDIIDLVYDPGVNNYRGLRTIQLNIKDMRIN